MATTLNLSPQEARKHMNLMIAGTAAWCCFGAVSIGPVFSGLLESLNLTEPQIGLVMAMGSLCLPFQLIGALIQQRYFRRRYFWACTTALYYFPFWILALLATFWQSFSPAWGFALFLMTYALSHAGVQLGASVQNGWIGEIVPERERASYWNRRQVVVLLASMVSGVLAGWCVDTMGKGERSTYAILLFVGTAFGMLSVFSQIFAPDRDTRGDSTESPWKQIRQVWENRSFRWITAFFLIQNSSICIFAGFYYIYLLKDMNLSMMSIQILQILAALAGLPAAFFFQIIGQRYGNKPILTICFSFKILETILCALWLPQILLPDQIGNAFLAEICSWFGCDPIVMQKGFFLVLPAFLLAGFFNVGVVTSQMALITSVGSPQLRSIAIGIFYTLIGAAGFCSTSLSGVLYKMLNGCTWVQESPFSAYHILAFTAAVGLTISLFFLQRFRENGAAATRQVVRVLISGNPIRNVIQAHLMAQPLKEGSRIEKLQHLHTDLISSEVAQGLYSPSSRIRDGALLNISTMETPISPALEQELIRLLDIPELGMQAMAARTLGRLQVVGSLPALSRHFRDPDLAIAQACIFAAGLIGDPAAEKDLRPLLADYRWRNRWTHTAEALSRLGNGDFRLARAIFPILNTEGYWVLRQQTLISLSRLMLENKEQAYLLFESENRVPGSEILYFLRKIAAHSAWTISQDERKQITRHWNQLWETKNYAECMEEILIRELDLFGIASQNPKWSQAEFLSSLFGAGSMRNRALEEETYCATSLWLQLKLWAELKYESDGKDWYLLLTFLIAAAGFLRCRQDTGEQN